MPTFLDIINEQLAETVEFTGRSGFKLDGSRLLLRTASDAPIRIYFLHEGAGYHNTLGYCWTLAGAEEKGTKYILFPDASMKAYGDRTTWEPLHIGDFVEMDAPARRQWNPNCRVKPDTEHYCERYATGFCYRLMQF